MANIITTLLPLPGFRMLSATHLNTWAQQINSAFSGATQTTTRATAANNLTATPSGTQSNALLLTAQVNRISTVGTAADSVKLPPSQAGLIIQVINGAASNSMQVYGSGTDTINDVATATGVAQAAGKSAEYYCPAVGVWYRNLSA